MEGRSFFENSPMAEVVISATPQEWAEVYQSLGEVDPWLDKTSPAWKLEKALTEAGVI